jgi:hypothetical protein
MVPVTSHSQTFVHNGLPALANGQCHPDTLRGLGRPRSTQPPNAYEPDYRNDRQLAKSEAPAKDKTLPGQVQR